MSETTSNDGREEVTPHGKEDANDNIPELAKRLISQIESGLRDSPNVSRRQLDDIDAFGREIIRLCKIGKTEEAERCHTLAMRTIKTGAPAKE